MATLDQVVAQIRFSLENLSASNAHHTFEDVCRYLAHAKIRSNILPATGPVSAGGDQGRDFETYRTYLTSAGLASTPFLGITATKPIVFACSLDKDVVGKIGDDVKKILATGERPDAIFFFSSIDVPVGKRHEVQKDINDKYSVKLEVIDGKAISEMLSDVDVFWIAERYLSVPAEIYPTRREEDWYAKALSEWKSQGDGSVNYATFVELKRCARHAALSMPLKPDVPFWISRLRMFRNENIPDELKRKVTYELAFVSLRGLGVLTGLEQDLRGYFGKSSGLRDPADLEDAAALLNYCIGAEATSSVALNLEELAAWRATLVQTVEALLNEKSSPGRTCALLDLRGYLSLVIDVSMPAIPSSAEALKWWKKMIEVLPNAPLYPLERFSDRLTGFIQFLEITPDYLAFSLKIDELLADRYGGFVAAEKCRDRAMKLYDRNSLLKALDQLHTAKVKWFTDETLKGSLLSMLFISHCYDKLGLTFASKYYALSAAHIAINSSRMDLKSFVPRALFRAMDADYHHGSWVNFLDLAPVALAAHNAYAPDPADLERHEEFEHFIFNVVTIQTITERLYPDLTSFVQERIQQLQLDDMISDLVPVSRESWKNKTDKQICEVCSTDLLSTPFCDIGISRETDWAASGIEWSMSWENDHVNNAIGEQLAAILQIIIADLAAIDLCVISTTVAVDVKAHGDPETVMRAIPSNKGRRWEISMPFISQKNDDIEPIQSEVVAHAAVILGETSLLPFQRFREILELKFKNGLSSRTFVGGPYDLIYSQFVTSENFNRNDRRLCKIPKLVHRIETRTFHDEMKWKDGPGPTYDHEEALELIRNRYTNSLKPIRRTLPQLAGDQRFLEVVRKLRQEGWRDWHILSSISTATVNYRARVLTGVGDVESFSSNCMRLINEEETESSIRVPLTEYTEDVIRLALDASLISTLRILGLDCRQETPDFRAIEGFLAKRYNYWIDDIEHTDPFPLA